MRNSRAALLLVGNWIGGALVAYMLGRVIEATATPSPLRDTVVLLMWPLVIIAGTVITVVWIVTSKGATLQPGKMESAPERRQPEEPTREREGRPAPDLSAAPVPPIVGGPSLPSDLDVAPQYLWSLFEDRLDIDARADLEPYLGKPMTVSGPLGDLTALGTFAARVTFPYGTFSHSIYMDFDVAWMERLRLITKGTKIVVRGTLTDVSSIDLHLGHCQIVKVGP